MIVISKDDEMSWLLVVCSSCVSLISTLSIQKLGSTRTTCKIQDAKNNLKFTNPTLL